jgi:hypothetical protein
MTPTFSLTQIISIVSTVGKSGVKGIKFRKKCGMIILTKQD